MDFEWDKRKARLNFAKHGIHFEEACTVFLDPLSATGMDPDHSVGEYRWVTFGLSEFGRLLTVAHTERDDRIRIISARQATRTEKALYEQD